MWIEYYDEFEGSYPYQFLSRRFVLDWEEYCIDNGLRYDNSYSHIDEVRGYINGIDNWNTSGVQDMRSMFSGCSELITIPQLDISNVTQINSIFYNCAKLTNLTLLNIKINLQISNGSTYGHLLTVDSLINICKECINTGSNKTLKMGSANTNKLSSVYVSLTNDPEADENNPKLPCEVCESTDEGAMLITDYMALKKWTLS